MDKAMKEALVKEIEGFELPTYKEIPNVGLYLEQTTKYISDYLEPLDGINLTGSMISNYVKKKIIKNPVKKQYDREQIAYLIFIAVAKSVLALDDIQLLLQLQTETYDLQKAYEYFRLEFLYALDDVFGKESQPVPYSDKNEEEKMLLRKTVKTVANKIYLDKVFTYMRKS